MLREVRRPEPAVERRHVGVGLLEPGVLPARRSSGRRRRAGCARRPPPIPARRRRRPSASCGSVAAPRGCAAGRPPVPRPCPRSHPRRTGSRSGRGSAGRPRSRTPSRRPSATGPLPVSSTHPTSGVIRAWSSARYSSSTVCGRKALRTSGRSNAIRTVPRAGPAHAPVVGDVGEVEARHACQAEASKSSLTTAVTVGVAIGGRPACRRSSARPTRRHSTACPSVVTNPRRPRSRGRHRLPAGSMTG